MTEPRHTPEHAAPPEQAVGRAIQDLTAARLGRGFLPLAVLGLTGIVETILTGVGTGPMLLGLGALGAGAAMLGYGLRVTQHAFGRSERAWMKAAMVGSVVPPAYALYVIAWRGFRGLFAGGGPVAVVMAVFFAVTGVWALRSWMRVVEVERLAKVMATDFEGGGR